MLSFTDPALESVVSGVQARGQQNNPSQGRSAGPDANLSGGKQDLYVTREYVLTAAVAADGTVTDKLVLTYHYPVQTNPANLNLLKNLGGNYNDYVQVFVPANTTLNNLQLTAGGTTTSVSAEDITSGTSLTTFAYFLLVPMGQTVSLEFDYSGSFEASGGSYQLAWEKQLNALTWPITLDVQLPRQPARHWSSDLSIDREFSTP